MKLNLGAGESKIEGYISIDVEGSCKPDVICDFTKDSLPYGDGLIEEVLLFHTIEHIQKRLHKSIFKEVWRVLKPGGRFVLSYPEFKEIAQRWLTNHKGNKEFWEATIYGRQLFPSDFHVCAMDSVAVRMALIESGFLKPKTIAEPEPNEFNSITIAHKGDRLISYEEQVSRDPIVLIK